MYKIIDKIRKELLINADEKSKTAALRFFKEEIKLYGLKTPDTNRIAKENYSSLEDKSRENIFSLCEELWKSGFIEESIIACEWSFKIHKQYKQEDFQIFDRWVKTYVNNWASCDTLCNHSVGTLIEMYPDLISELKKWALSQNRWVKRASAVTLIIPAKKGLFLGDIIEIADILHSDKDDLVQKGYGWMLKAASQVHQQEIFRYIMKVKSSMPRTSLRYAIEKMPSELKAMAMAK